MKKLFMVLLTVMTFCLLGVTSYAVDRVVAEGYEIDVNGDDYKGKIVYLTKTDQVYHIYGQSNNTGIVINGGSESKPIRVKLDYVRMNLRNEKDNDKSCEFSPISVIGRSQAVIELKGENYLYGGNDTGFGDNDGYAGLYCGPWTTVRITGENFGRLEAWGGGNDDREKGGAGVGGNSKGATGVKDQNGNQEDSEKKYNSKAGRITIDGQISVIGYGAEGAAGIGGGRGGSTGIITLGEKAYAFGGGGKGGAGIGCGKDINDGDRTYVEGIVINDCMVKAIGGENAAGIGGGQGGVFTETPGYDSKTGIRISGSRKIEAYGGSNGAGIGLGDDNVVGSDLYKATHAIIEINLNNGEIIAEGGQDAAGIGGGDDSDMMPIYLKGSGTITATGKGGGAAIGAGDGSHTDTNYKQIIDISGTLDITATAGSDACAIGAGDDTSWEKVPIVIHGEEGKRDLKITAHTDEYNAAAIGSYFGKCADIKISNATIKASAGKGAAAIGNGNSSAVGSDAAHGELNLIQIKNCSIDTTETQDVGIGAGYSSKIKKIELIESDYNGSQIGSGDQLNNMFNSGPNDMDYIKIIDCGTVIARAQGGTKTTPYTAIGSGVFGNMPLIEISGCDHIEAYGLNGGPGIGASGVADEASKQWVCGYEGGTDVINISDCKYIKAVGSSGHEETTYIPSSSAEDPGEKIVFMSYAGAGIGCGAKVYVKEINIKNCGTIEAYGGDDKKNIGAAGIGGGSISRCESLNIENCDKIIAKGGVTSPGIGSGGLESSLWDAVNNPDETINSNIHAMNLYTGPITIKNCGSVEATGGSDGCGIGCGKAAEMKGIITIDSSNITAKGGKNAAGIGSSRSEECKGVTITGDVKYVINATGGDYSAGIGSAYYKGDAKDIEIKGCTVNATGGSNAPGIGSGAAKDYVVDRSGALKNITIEGGIVTAKGGSNCKCDIGTGNNHKAEDDPDYKIKGGTVYAERWSTVPVVQGGSVHAEFVCAKNDAGKNVYKTCMKTLAPNQKILLSNVSCDENYGTNDIFSDSDSKVYLYLQQIDSVNADVSYDAGLYKDEIFKYTGHVTGTDNWLKMKSDFAFEEDNDVHIIGDTFKRVLNTSSLPKGAKITYSLSEGSPVQIDTENTSDVVPDTSVTLKADYAGEYELTAEIEGADTELYWNTKAVCNGEIKKSVGHIYIIEELDKVYDGEAVSNPLITTNNTSEVKYEYFDENGQEMNSAPKDAGTYTVKASVEEKEFVTAASTSQEFVIAPASLHMNIKAEEDDADATVYVETLGMVDGEDDGEITITVYDGNSQEGTNVESLFSEVLSVSEAAEGITFEKAASGKYRVVAEYEYSGSGNYACEVNPVEAVLDKNLASVSMDLDNTITKVYGDDDFVIEAVVTDNDGDVVEGSLIYEIASDNYVKLEAVLDEKAAGGPYSKLEPGTYNDVITVKLMDAETGRILSEEEAALTAANYNVVIDKGTLTVKKEDKPGVNIIINPIHFVDVPDNSWYKDSVYSVAYKGLMKGTSQDHFSPDMQLTRGMMVTILYRMEGSPAINFRAGFKDVATGSYYASAVAWAKDNGIVKGYSDTAFGPEDKITREQMTSIMFRYSQFKRYDTSKSDDLSKFTDVGSISEYAVPSVKWAAGEGIVNGNPDGLFRPQGFTTRAEAAAILDRFYGTVKAN